MANVKNNGIRQMMKFGPARPLYIYSYTKHIRDSFIEKWCGNCIVQATCTMKVKSRLLTQRNEHYGIIITKPCDDMIDAVECTALVNRKKGLYRVRGYAAVEVFKIKERIDESE